LSFVIGPAWLSSFGGALGRFEQKATKRTRSLHLCFLRFLLLIYRSSPDGADFFPCISCGSRLQFGESWPEIFEDMNTSPNRWSQPGIAFRFNAHGFSPVAQLFRSAAGLLLKN